MILGIEGFEDCEKFFVIYIIVEFSGLEYIRIKYD